MKVAIYCRLSEEDRNKQSETDDSLSIQNQKLMLMNYAEEKHWDIYKIYSDDDYAGSDRRRPEFNALINDAENHKFDIVLCKSQSRFTRELELVEKYINGLFPIWGIRFVSIVDNADTDNKGNKKARQINGLINEWYLEDMSESIKSVLTNRRKNGYHIGSFALYGYKKDPDQRGHLIIDEEAAAVVREVFTLYSQGYGKTAIARMLNDRGIPNPTEYKRRCGLRYKGARSRNSTLWKYFAISDMLVNQIYIGDMVQGKIENISYKSKEKRMRPKESWYIVEGTHEPIIDRALWDRVQAMVAERAKPFDTGQIGLFARKARCAHCGYTMRSTKNHGKHYLQCPTRHIAMDACMGSFISVERLERIVLAELKRLAAEYLDKDAVERNIELCAGLQEKKEGIKQEIEAYNKKIAEYAKGIRDMYLDKVKGLLSDSDYLNFAKEFTKEKSRLEFLVTECEKKINDIDSRIEAGENRKETVERYLNLEHLNREMVETLIDYIDVSHRIPDTRDVPVEIHWKF